MTCQKLIFGGKLLLEQLTLSEALPESNEGEPTVIHLVAYQRSMSAPSTTSATSVSSDSSNSADRAHSSASLLSTSSEGLHNRQGVGSTTSQQQQQQRQQQQPPSQPLIQNTDPRDDRMGPIEQPSQRVVCSKGGDMCLHGHFNSWYHMM